MYANVWKSCLEGVEMVQCSGNYGHGPPYAKSPAGPAPPGWARSPIAKRFWDVVAQFFCERDIPKSFNYLPRVKMSTEIMWAFMKGHPKLEQN